MTFAEVVKVTIETPGFLAEYDRLFNTTFTRGGIEHAVDVATGKFNDDAVRLLAFIYEVVWCRLPEEVRHEGG